MITIYMTFEYLVNYDLINARIDNKESNYQPSMSATKLNLGKRITRKKMKYF